MSRQGFGEDFGQKVDLTASIRNILRNYPEGTAVLKELVQNADDAGARSVSFCLDCRSHQSAKVAGPLMGQFQGPSLVSYNDAVFTEEDFRSIQRIGDSLKKSEESKTKIGRFGIGFNAVYHWTDLPSFISSKYLVLLDPQARFLPDVNPSNPGKMVNWLSKPEMLESFSDQFAPYLGYSNLNYKNEFKGTLFRLPLRTLEQAQSSMLSKRHLSIDDALQLLQALRLEASAMLLFLKNIECIEIKVWHEDENTPRMLFKCHIANVSGDLKVQRGLGQLPNQLFTKDVPSKDISAKMMQSQKADFTLQIQCESSNESSHAERWEVCNQLGGLGANRIAHDPANALLRLVPWGGLAACVGSSQVLSSTPSSQRPTVGGLAYCFLPLPVQTGLPVMVNGFFELSSNRRDIWQAGPDMTGDGKTRAEWNLSLISDVIAPSYVRLLLRLRDSLGYSEVYQNMWPSSSLSAPWSLLASSALLMCRSERLLYTLENDALTVISMATSLSSLPRNWIQTNQAVLLPSDNRLNDSSRAELASFLYKSQQPLVSCSEPLRVSLIDSKTCEQLATPAFARAVLRQKTGSFKASGGGYVPEPEMCTFLLHYCLLDCSPDRPSAELDWLAVLPLLSLAVGSLRIYSSAQSEKIANICDMGFTFSQATAALNRCNYALDAAMDLLTTTEPAAGDASKSKSAVAAASDSIFILAGEEESRVFRDAKTVLLDRGKISAGDIDFLLNPSMVRSSNIRAFRAQLIPDLLRHILPPAFFDGNCILASSLAGGAAGGISEFLAEFWRYAAPRGEVVDAIAQGAALVPSQGQGAFLPLSRISGLLVASRGDISIPDSIQEIFRALGLHIVDPSALPDNGSMCNSFWQYVYGPSRSALLAALEFATKRSGGRRHLCEALTAGQIDALRTHICLCEPVSHLTDSDKEMLRRLPLFKAYGEGGGGSASYVSVDEFKNRHLCFLADAARLPETLFPSHFLWNSSSQEAALLRSLGVKALRRSDYFRLELLPRVRELLARLPQDTTSALLTMMSDIRSLVDEDKDFLAFLKNEDFLPALAPDSSSTPRVCRASELFDPHVRTLRTILDDSLFPLEPFQQDEVLVLLRTLGLQGSLDWPAVVACARAIESAPRTPSRVERGAALLAYLDRNIGKLVARGKDDKGGAKGFILNLAQSIFRDKDSNSQKKMTMEDYLFELQRVRWVPVLTLPLGPCMPWSTVVVDDLAAPIDVRPAADAWLCSATKRLLAERAVCEELSRVLLWSEDIDTTTIATQLRELSRKFVLLKKELDHCAAGTASEQEFLPMQKAREEVTGLIPQLYQRLNIAVENTQAKSMVCELLLGEQWIWVGDAFVPPSRVAVASTVNAAPYLYQLPQDLRVYAKLFRAFAVKSSFLPRDYIEVLGTMADETDAGSRALSDQNIDLAVSLVTLLSMEGSVNHHNHSIYVPDNTNRLAVSTTLVNDDVPWLSGPDYASARAGCRLIHPNISSHVAERLGVKSLRLTIVNRSLEQNIFSLPADSGAAAMEAFGQAESLTGRLKTILDMYPDGNPIFSELIQNADDAGATTVRIMIDMNSYGAESLLDSKMAPLQGPALLVCNDAMFTEADFRSLARIGQGSKLEKLATTGRFGLGFSSTYHLTDTPTFVSGSHLVVFDPHCAFAPGATLNQPGLRIKFNDSSLRKTFPDQFSPFEFFGCDFSQPYSGTLFRFPLRNSALARRSEISKRSYTTADVEANLSQFIASLPQHLLFLRSVRCIEIYRCSAGERDPTLLHRAQSAPSEHEARGEQALLSYFDRKQQSSSAQPPKEDFYRRLASTPEGKLPIRSCRISVLVESFHEEQHLLEVGAAATAAADSPPAPAVHVARAVEVPPPAGEAVSGQLDLPKTAALLRAKEEVLFIVVTGLCGGEARRVACSEEMRHLKLVPLGSVAACLARTSSGGAGGGGLFSPLSGQAFCFLPLPVHTGLPVHSNAYWELSSNRRDIWKGDDTKGEARARSEWNTHIMRDIIAPLYRELLVGCALLCTQQLRWAGGTLQGHPRALLSLLPCPEPREPWSIVSSSLLLLLQNDRLLFSSLRGGVTLSLKEAVLLELTGDDDQQSEESAVRSRLESLLLEEGVPVVVLPAPVHKALLASGCAGASVSPEYMRTLLAGARKRPTLQGEAMVSNATFYLRYCLRDISRSNYSALRGIGIMPLENGSLGCIGMSSDPPLYLATDAERRLLQRAGARLLAADSVLGAAASACLRDTAFSADSNVRPLEPSDIVALIATFIVPSSWLATEAFSPVDRRGVLPDDWLLALWSYAIDSRVLDLFRDGLPLLPVLRQPCMGAPDGLFAVKVAAAVPVLHMSYSTMSPLAAGAFAQLGLYIFDPEVLGALSYSQAVTALLQEPSVAGVIAALSLLKDRYSIADRWTAQARDAVREFILDSLLAKVDSVPEGGAAVLASLPVWQRQGCREEEDASGGTAAFASLVGADGGVMLRLPPLGVDPHLLDGKYLRVRGSRDRVLYKMLGVEEHSSGDFFAEYVVVKVCEGSHFTNVQTDALAVEMLRNLTALTKECPSLADSLGNCPIIRTRTGRLASPKSLFDPSPQLQSLLPEGLFPCPQLFSSPPLLLALRQLGLSTSVTCVGVTFAAQAVQSDLDLCRSPQMDAEERSACMRRAVARATALLKYVEVNVDALLAEIDPEGLSALGAVDVAGSSSSSTDCSSSKLGGSWAQELRTLMWVPVLLQPPRGGSRAVDGLPWPERVHASALAAPSQSRPLQDMWSGSSTHRICCFDVLSQPLRLLLGWDRPLAGRNLSLQLLNMKDTYDKIDVSNYAAAREAVSVVYSKEVPRLFEAMSVALERESAAETEVWLKILRDKAIIWVGGQFVEAARIAFDPLPGVSCEPYLYSLGGELLSYPSLMRGMGVRQIFAAGDLAAMTRSAFLAAGDGPVSTHKLQVCLGVAKILARLITGQGLEEEEEEREGEGGADDDAREEDVTATVSTIPNPLIPLSSLGVIYLPDRSGCLLPASTLSYDDAPWISKALSQKSAGSTRFVHTAIMNSEAATLGARSLREQLFSGDAVVCPEAPALRATLGADTIRETLSDLLSLADILGARAMNVMFDEVEHPCESLMHPGLADAQGPGLIVHLDGPALSTEEIAQVLTSPHLLPSLPGQLAPQEAVASPAKGGPASHTDSQAVRYPFPTSGKRLMSAFAITDCLQIISGGEFYVFDPSGLHLLTGGDDLPAPKAIHRPDAPRARAQRCELLGTSRGGSDMDVLYRFPDQFAPFLSAPFNLEATLKGKGGKFPGLLIRMPLRRAASAVSDTVASVDDVREALRMHRSRLQGALLFASCLSGGSVQHREPLGSAERDFEVWLASSQGARDKRWAILADRGWKRSGITSLFASQFVPPEVANELLVRTNLYGLSKGLSGSGYGWLQWAPSLLRLQAGTEPVQDSVEIEDVWWLCSVSGYGRMRDLAIAAPYRTMKLQPLVTLAIRQLSSAEMAPGALSVPPEPGHLYCGGGPVGPLGLPYIIEGPFLHDFLARAVPLSHRSGDSGSVAANMTVSMKVGGSEGEQSLGRGVVEAWNSAILSVALERLLPRALQHMHALCRRESAEAFYKYWPYQTRIDPTALLTLEQSKVYSLLADMPIFLIVSGFQALKSVVIPDSHLRSEVQTFLQSILPLALTPSQIAADLASARVSTQCLTPSRLREFLRRDGSAMCARLAGRLQLLLQLLKYALADAEKARGAAMGEFQQRKLFREVGGTPLLPMADGSVRAFPRSARERVVVAPLALHALLPRLKAQYVDPLALPLLPVLSDPLFMDCAFISRFTASFLQENIPAVIPSSWRRCDAVCWSEGVEIGSRFRLRPGAVGGASDDNNTPTPRPSDLLLYVLWADALAKEELTALDGLRDWPIVPVVSRGRRLLLSAALLPHILCHPSTAPQDAQRSFLANEAGRVASLAQPAHAAEGAASSPGSYVWQWTTEPASSADSRVAAASMPSRELLDSSPHQPTAAAEAVTQAAVPGMDELVTAAATAEDSVGPDAQGGLSAMTPSVVATLQKLGLPFLDGGVLGGPPAALAGAAATPLGRRLLDALHAFVSRDVHVHTLPAETSNVVPVVAEAVLDFDAISVAERSALLLEIHRSHREAAFSTALVDRLKALRLFTSKVALKPTAITECSAAFWCENDRALDGISLSSRPRATGDTAAPPVILVNDRALHEVYTLVGVEELTAPAAVRRFTLPALSSADGSERLSVLISLAPRWSSLKTDTELVRLLSDVAFIPSWNSAPNGSSDMTGPYRRARDVFSWSNESLLETLAGAQQSCYFTPPAIRTPDLHAMLIDLGMAAELNKDAFYRLAQDLHNTVTACRGEEPVMLAAAERGRRLLRYLRAGDCAAALPLDSDLARRLSKLSFVPMWVPSPMSTGGHIAFTAQVGRFDQLLSRSCGALGFSVYPVLDEDISPPLYFHSSFGVTTQPSLETVLKHISALAGCGEYLDRWNHPFFSIRSTYSALFQYLHDHWKDISPSASAQLRASNIVPVGHTLVRPQRLFFRLAEDLSPFMHEVPRYFGPHEGLLKDLGVKEAPAAEDYVVFLRDLAAECGSTPLNPNELRAVVQIVGAISAQTSSPTEHLTAGGAATGGELLFAPDEDSILRCTLDLVRGDDLWMRDRAGGGLAELGVHFLHPSITSQAAEPLRVPALSSVLLEALPPGEAIDEDRDSVAARECQRVLQALAEPQMAAALAALQAQSSVEALRERLQSLRVRCANRLTTRFLLRDPRKSSGDIPVARETDGSALAFLETSGDACGTLYVNTGLLQQPITIEIAVSIGLCKLLSMPVHLAASIASLLSAAPEDLQRVLHSLRLGGGTAAAREKQRGTPGELLVGADSSLIELKPFRVFQLGEAVAYSDGSGLRYGKVLQIADKGEGGIRRLQLRTGSSSLQYFLSTDVYSFRSARGGDTTSSSSSPQKAARLSSALEGFTRGLALAASPPRDPSGDAPAATEPAHVLYAAPHEPVRREELLSVVSNLLVRAGVPLDLTEDSMVAKIMAMDSTIKRLQEEVRAERGRLSEARDAASRMSAAMKCQICVAEDNSHVAVPCGHQLCAGCSERCGARCPFCRAAIRQVVRVFSESAQEDA